MRLASWIKETSVPLPDFAKAVGVTEEAVRRYCIGKRMPEPEIAERIVEATKGAVTVQDLHEARMAFLRSLEAAQ